MHEFNKKSDEFKNLKFEDVNVDIKDNKLVIEGLYAFNIYLEAFREEESYSIELNGKKVKEMDNIIFDEKNHFFVIPYVIPNTKIEYVCDILGRQEYISIYDVDKIGSEKLIKLGNTKHSLLNTYINENENFNINLEKFKYDFYNDLLDYYNNKKTLKDLSKYFNKNINLEEEIKKIDFSSFDFTENIKKIDENSLIINDQLFLWFNDCLNVEYWIWLEDENNSEKINAFISVLKLNVLENNQFEISEIQDFTKLIEERD